MSDAALRLRGRAAVVGARLADLLASTPAAEDRRWESAIRFLRDLLAESQNSLPPTGGDDPFRRVCRRLDLTPLEADALLLAGLPEEHEGCASVLRLLHPRGEPRPTAGLMAQLSCATPRERAALRAVLEGGRAVTAGALRVQGDAPFGERSLLPADGLWSALGGAEAWPSGARVRRAPPPLAGLEEWLATPAARRAARAIATDRPVTVVVSAEDAEVGLARAHALAVHAGRDAAAVRLGLAADEEQARTIGVLCLALDLVPVFGATDEHPERGAWPAEPAAHPGAVVVVAPPGAAACTARPVLLVPTPRLTHAARGRAWRALVPALAGDAATLAVRYALEPEQIAAVAHDLAVAADGAPPTLADVAACVRARGQVELGTGVTLVRPIAGWSRLVLSEDRMTQLREATDRLAHSATVFDAWGYPDGRPGSRGVRLLFCGPPGVGKSFAAEAMAHELGVDLLVVDLSRLVSKWLGETEKNLARVFDRAERAQAVLLFDEADALFAKRTEVSDAHDRYANLETAYLLSRLERFDGIAILATNLKDQIDPAFLRRLEFVVDFDEPGVAERERLWRAHLPPGAPLAPDVAPGELAELYPLAGGLIRNASLAAGFLATANGGTITRDHLIHAVRREYEKAGRAFPGVPANW